jgi:predicted membrane chloride channel (bestrophin family)
VRPTVDERTLKDFERALEDLAAALRECERLLSTTPLPQVLVHDETFQRLLWLLRVEGDDADAPPAQPSGAPPLLH